MKDGNYVTFSLLRAVTKVQKNLDYRTSTRHQNIIHLMRSVLNLMRDSSGYTGELPLLESFNYSTTLLQSHLLNGIPKNETELNKINILSDKKWWGRSRIYPKGLLFESLRPTTVLIAFCLFY